jgi:zinc transporter 1
LRAEILGAFFNAVFLIALCLSIILEAITRFVDPPTISNPKLILIVGSLGLASNIVGFFVLGGHGHSHGPGGHDHGHSHEGEHDHVHDHTHGDELGQAEEGHSHAVGTSQPSHSHNLADESGRPADVFPEVAVSNARSPRRTRRSSDIPRHIKFTSSDETASTSRGDDADSPLVRQNSSRSSNRPGKSHSRRSSSISRLAQDIQIHPASFRAEIIEASRMEDINSGDDDNSDPELALGAPHADITEHSPLRLNPNDTAGTNMKDYAYRTIKQDNLHDNHHHTHPKKKKSGGGHGHNHGDMGMNAMVLHVIGDALGNVGVIITALIIWLTDLPGRFYADPAVSLFITLIILRSAIPLTSATAKILLQATPDHIEVSDIKDDIQGIPGVVSCHHVHIWQLSDSQIIASLHIQVAFPIDSQDGAERYMQVAKAVRSCLHAYGIHSATIQPEFCMEPGHEHLDGNGMAGRGGPGGIGFDGPGGGAKDEPHECMLECVADCDAKACCGQSPSKGGSVAGSVASRRSPPHDHDHEHDDHDHGHGHGHEGHSH